jgi:PKHD-type hydroxylase
MWYLKQNNQETWAWYNCFSQDECNKIIEQFSDQLNPAEIVGNSTSVRNSDVYFIPTESENYWIYESCTRMVNQMNPDFFGYELDYIEELQFTCYDSTNGNQHYGKHTDIVNGEHPRKLSFSILLNLPSSFDGGDLKIWDSAHPTIPEQEQGKGILFPSYVLHEVAPVTKGIRYSLVGWVHGPNFR